MTKHKDKPVVFEWISAEGEDEPSYEFYRPIQPGDIVKIINGRGADTEGDYVEIITNNIGLLTYDSGSTIPHIVDEESVELICKSENREDIARSDD